MKNRKQFATGFTLIELLITVAIVGVISAFAIPSYNQYIIRANRADAKTALLAVAQRLEQNYTVSGRYDRLQDGVTLINDAMIATWGLSQTPLSGTARYNITFVGGVPTQTSFQLQAVPANAQIADTTCGTLQIDNRNLKSANGQNNRHQTTLDCWNK